MADDFSGIGYGTGSASGNGLRAAEPFVRFVPRKLITPTCSDKKILPIWNELKKDSEFIDQVETFDENADCTNRIEIDEVDLNRDSRREYIVWGRYNFCGGTGNCSLWVLEKRRGKLRMILSSGGYYGESKWFEVKKRSTNGFRDLLIKGHFTAAETHYGRYKYYGRKYVESDCKMEIYSSNAIEPQFISCREHERRINSEIINSN
ncbi:MAG: hypothetical protein KIS76_07770 [Pyrinomonadaceae bacterium]|nr:hypothetical protein [Pyrinomonadaceae bacterium]